MITLPLKHSRTKWIKFDDVKFKIDYLTLEQRDKLNEMLFTLAFLDNTLLSKGELSKDLDPAKKSKLLMLNSKYYRLFLKYTIKDWQGIVDEKGKPVKCKLTVNEDDIESGTELDNHQWVWLCKCLTIDDLANHWAMINKEIAFDDTDKKK